MEGRILESTSRLVLSGFRTVVWFVPSGRDVSWSETGGAKLDSDYSWAVVVLPIFSFCLLFVSDLFLCMFCRQLLLYVVGTLRPAGEAFRGTEGDVCSGMEEYAYGVSVVLFTM